ncbi:hypothetical protein IE81DRAFT_38380 [Ceraceosorus guamensis]|uniref:Uncharacterized protein n=1 Tax=Ceraceosorus guamensis TaxID=1522189 RepID=A0A316W355_9BASI|nr:hypothetical protein IE81DRAFT_38380 [Ceraceosorus guamensis]PWN44220.1 hypothetical protein IE81DRAFT_38380 [Ceraceosorus guamensis]
MGLNRACKGPRKAMLAKLSLRGVACAPLHHSRSIRSHESSVVKSRVLGPTTQPLCTQTQHRPIVTAAAAASEMHTRRSIRMRGSHVRVVGECPLTTTQDLTSPPAASFHLATRNVCMVGLTRCDLILLGAARQRSRRSLLGSCSSLGSILQGPRMIDDMMTGPSIARMR